MAETSETADVPLLTPRGEGEVGPTVMIMVAMLGWAIGWRAWEMAIWWENWMFSKPMVVLDVVLNLVFMMVSVVMLVCTGAEQPNMPIRVWMCVYALLCMVRVVRMWLGYRRRNRRRFQDVEAPRPNSNLGAIDTNNEDVEGAAGIINRPSVTKRCESVNTMVSFLWWILGFYWVVSGGDTLLHKAPHLYWLAVVFLAFDVFFALFCVVLACLIGIALCCCLPCIIAILYAVAGQEGASDADLSLLSRYRFQSSNNEVGAGRMVPVETNSGHLANERTLLPEDAECCICLSPYDNGAEVHALPCSHHFHSPCIVKWLKMNATCPLCKYNILKGGEQL